ncbi:ABC transporter permease, partial [Myxococcus xanthus]|nr:ABC transporter permease [Myxococcus xanthus]
IRMWSDLESRLDVSIAAISSLMVFFTLVLMVLMERFAGISRRMR